MTERTHSFTGKSDFFDWCNMHYTPETIIEKATIFLGDAEIKKDKPEDLIPYYTHLIASAGCTPEKQSIFLSSRSWIDQEERERIAIMLYILYSYIHNNIFDFYNNQNQKLLFLS